MNKTIRELQNVCVSRGLRIAKLTNLHGDCLFESLLYHKIGKDVASLRAGLASVMHIFRKKKNFFPGQDETLEDLFLFANEIEYATGSVPIKVGDKTKWEENYYKYDYNVMLQDLSNQYCWDALPTQLILMLLSLLYKLDITIIHSNGHQTNVNVYQGTTDPPVTRKIFLGLLGESHYIPTEEIYEDDDINPPEYEEALHKFTKWAREKEKEIVQQWRLELQFQKEKKEKNDSNGSEDGSTKDEDIPTKIKFVDPAPLTFSDVSPVETEMIDISGNVDNLNLDLDLDAGVSF
jgi:hypothetical protein